MVNYELDLSCNLIKRGILMGLILSVFIVFFFLLYALCEKFKYRRTVLLKNNTCKKLYFEPVCYIKLVLIVLDFILILINRTFFGIVERSSGVRSLVYLLVLFVLIIIPSIIDIHKIRNGYNDYLLENEV